MKYGDIVVYGGEIGEIVTSDGLYNLNRAIRVCVLIVR